MGRSVTICRTSSSPSRPYSNHTPRAPFLQVQQLVKDPRASRRGDLPAIAAHLRGAGLRVLELLPPRPLASTPLTTKSIDASYLLVMRSGVSELYSNEYGRSLGPGTCANRSPAPSLLPCPCPLEPLPLYCFQHHLLLQAVSVGH